MNNKTLGLILSVVAFYLFIVVAYFLPGANIGGADVPLRFLAVLIGALGMGIAYYFTRANDIWTLGVRQVTNGVAGAMLYAVFIWLFSGGLFKVPAVGGLELRPAVVLPVLFGCLFGPLTGFLAGGFGHIAGDMLAGRVVSPEWDMGSALIGFVAGMHLLFADKKRAVDWAWGLAAALGVAATIGYLFNLTVTNQIGEGPITPWLGYSVPAGLILCLAIRYAFPDSIWGEIVVWAALGNLAGLGLAAIADIWIRAGQLMPAEAVIGQLIPAAGPNLIALAVFMPILIAGYGALQQAEAA